MRFWISLLLTIVTSAGAAAAAAQLTEDERNTLRERIQARYDVVPLSDGIALRPKTRSADIRLIEIADGSISINGTVVSGRELRERLRTDADSILRLSYLPAQDQKTLFQDAVAQHEREMQQQAEHEREMERERQRVRDEQARADPTFESRPRRARGERVNVFGDVHVAEDEEVGGDVVAVIGDVRVDGYVRGQVVAVLGSVQLGPKSIVNGDVVSVGGRVDRAAGAQPRGGVTQVAVGGPNIHIDPWFRGWGPGWGFGFPGFGAVPRLIGSGFRLLLLLLLAGMALVIARPTVEAAAQRAADDPVKTTLVGLAAELLILPVMLLAALVFLMTIILSPLIVLLPFVLLLMVLMALAGFTGVAGALGRWTQRRFGLASSGSFVAIALGVVIVLLPLLVGRLIAIGGWPLAPFATWFIAIGFIFELLVWACGLGAVLTNSMTRWRARRATTVPAVPPPATA